MFTKDSSRHPSGLSFEESDGKERKQEGGTAIEPTQTLNFCRTSTTAYIV